MKKSKSQKGKTKTKLKAKNKPKFIVLLGGEGSGKSTMVRLVQENFGQSATGSIDGNNSNNNTKVVVTREPGGSPYAEKIRDTMFDIDHGHSATTDTQFHLAWAARFEHVDKLVMPSLDSGISVVSDRFDCCTFAYQVSAGDKSLTELFWEIRSRLKIKPDLYIFLDVKVEEGLKRAAARKTGNNYFDTKKLGFHKKVRKGYLDFLKKVPHKVIDANRSLTDVSAEFMDLMHTLL